MDLIDKHSLIEDMLELYVLPEDREIVREVLRKRGAIYGGYLRDVIAGEEPNDIDIILSELRYGLEFIKYLLSKGYQLDYEGKNDTIIATKSGARKLELAFVEDSPDEVLIGPVSGPDFDVNLLLLGEDGVLRNWMDPNEDIIEIIENITSRRAVRIEADRDRIRKMSQKGYTIV